MNNQGNENYRCNEIPFHDYLSAKKKESDHINCW